MTLVVVLAATAHTVGVQAAQEAQAAQDARPETGVAQEAQPEVAAVQEGTQPTEGAPAEISPAEQTREPDAVVPEEPKLGDVADGSRADHIHVLDLRDETGALIRPDDPIALPFSPRQTCQECHEYETVGGGWHFNATDPEVEPGRRGEPWVLVDPVTATQVPLSARDWPGVAHPEEFGLSPFLFTERFGRHLPGGGVSEEESDEALDLYLRWMVSGKAEVNCLGCHDREAGHDQAEYDRQVRRQNYRWAAAATSAFTTVTGSAKAMPDNYDIYAGGSPDLADALPPTVDYDASRFNRQGKVLFDIPRRAPEERCYFCHSSVTVNESREERWERDVDVHMAAGLTCVDCHRNGLDHLITRGYEWEAADRNNVSVASLSCAGCHIRDQEWNVPGNGGMGAPYPAHRGLPIVHFESLACTACHSGPWPTDTAERVKLSRTHSLGTHGVKRGDDVAPHILSPVFVRDDDGKIAPHRMIWPAYWGFMQGEEIEPAPAEDVRTAALAAVLAEEPEGGPNVERLRAGGWPLFSQAQMVRILGDLAGLFPEKGAPVYVGGGKVFGLAGTDGASLSTEDDHPAAQPYTWAFAHDVRPAEQSLGIRGCDDCHALGAPFSFATVTAPVPFDFTEGATVSMTSLQNLNAVYPRVFAFTFLFRPLVKFTIIICSIIMLLVVLLYTLRGLEVVLVTWSGGDS